MSNRKYRIKLADGEDDEHQVKVIQEGVRLQVRLNKLKGAPIARFDSKTKKPYLEHPNGHKEYRHG